MMGTISTFGSFTQARLAIYASQAGLSVTGNNIANINTTGYTRQKLNQESFRSGGADRYQSNYNIRVGNGVLTTGVSQLRDPYLDIRYRSEISAVGAMDTKLGGLESIQAILDEVGDGDEAFGVIEAQFSDLFDALQKLSAQTGQAEYDIQVRSSAESLTKLFNSYASKLEDVYKNTQTAFEQDLETVNGLLTSIRDLNATIRKNEIHGDNALELKDERNLLIDQLSEYMKIDVTYTEEDIGAGQTVEKLVIKLANANPNGAVTTDSSTLIDGIYATQFSITQVPQVNPDFDATKPANAVDNFKYLKEDGSGTNNVNLAKLVDSDNYDLTISALTSSKGRVLAGSAEVKLDDNDLYGALQSERELLTESGEFASADTIKNVDENAATKRGIPYYQNVLDLLANQFAKAFNDANQDCVYNEKGEYVKGVLNQDGTITANGTFVFQYKDADQKDAEFTLTKSTTWDDIPNEVKKQMEKEMKDEGVDGEFSIKDYVAKKGGVSLGTPLFSNRGDTNDTTGITAKNISVSDFWSDGPQIVSSFELPSNMDRIPTTENSNISHMINLFYEKRDYVPSDISDSAPANSMFNGTFQEMWVNIGSVLGNDMKVTSSMLDMSYTSSVNLDTNRMGVSSVDLNDEAMNLMQYSQSYNAACRLMTTIDSVLDKLINGTGVTV